VCLAGKAFKNRIIALYDRHTGENLEEQVFGRFWMNFLYGTVFGRLLTRLLLKRRCISRIYGFFQNRRRSVRKIPGFIRLNNLNTEEIAKGLTDFTCFNDFFIRTLKAGSRPVDMAAERLVSPADCRLQACAVERDTLVPVKGRPCTLAQLLGDSALAEQYCGGNCLIFRLAPSDYHRFCYIDNGVQGPVRSLGAALDSVNPLVLAARVPVFAENHRHLCILETENFGAVQHLDVGAMLVGRVHQHKPSGGPCRKGEEKGYFLFGGSTIVLVFKQGIIALDEDISSRSAQGIEVIVRYGEGIGRRI